MFSATAGVSIKMPFRLELDNVGVTGKVGGSSSGNINVKLVNSDSTDWETLTVTTHFTVEELSLGDYVLTLLSGINDTEGFLEILIWDNNSEDTFKTERYVFNIRESVSSKFTNVIYTNHVNGTASTDFPYGTRKFPTKDLEDAISISNSNDIETIRVSTGIGASDSLSGSPAIDSKSLIGEGFASVDFNSSVTRFSIIENIEISGSDFGAGSLSNTFKNCKINNIGLSYDSTFLDCIFKAGTAFSFLAGGDNNYLLNCLFRRNATFDATNSKATLVNCGGGLEITNNTSGDIYLFGFKGDIVVDSSCTGGTIYIIGGSGKISDSSGAGCTVDVNGFLKGAGDATEDKQDAILVDTGATGALVSSIDSNVSGNSIGIYNNGVAINTIDGKVDTIDTNVDSIKADQLTHDNFVDFSNSEVLSRTTEGNPSQYEIGSGANKKTVDATYADIGGVEKVKKEVVS